jgi:hypothetical protein
VIEHLSDVLVRRLRGCRHPGHLLSLSLNKNRTRPVATSRRAPNQRHAYVSIWAGIWQLQLVRQCVGYSRHYV